VKIRLPACGDIPHLASFGPVAFQESRFAGSGYDSTKVEAKLLELVRRRPTSQCFLVAESADGQMAGVLIGCIEKLFFNDEYSARCLIVFVTPAFRGSSAAVKLILAFKRWAENRRAVDLCIGIAGGVHPARTDRFLKKLGFRLDGGNYSVDLRQSSTDRRVIESKR
jgi:hypothetical protein